MIDQARLKPSGRLRFSDVRGASLDVRARDIAARIVTTIYRRMFFMVIPLSENRADPFPAGLDVENRFITPSEIGVYLALRPDADREEILRRFAERHRCFVSWRDGRIVDACWAASGTVYVPYLKRFLMLPPRDVYFYDAYTTADYRGHSIANTRGGRMAVVYGNEGFDRAVALVAFENLTAWTVLTWVSVATTGAYYYLRIPPWGISWSRAARGHEVPPLVRSPAPSRAQAPLQNGN